MKTIANAQIQKESIGKCSTLKKWKQQMTILIFGTVCCLTINTAKAQPVAFYVQGHEDDWQLFMSSQVMVDLTASAKLVFITLTAGDAGYGATTGADTSYYGPGMIPYYLSRENGSVYASKYAYDILTQTPAQPGPTPVGSLVSVNYTNPGGNNVNHLITKYVYKNNIVNYFLRLPDGNGGGGFSGYPDFSQSLQQLRNGQITSITSVDSTATYNGWSDLVSTFQAITQMETTGQNTFWLNVASLNDSVPNRTDYNPADHSDHYAAAHLVWDTFGNAPQVGINGWVDYHSSTLSPNLTLVQTQYASELYGLCEFGKTQGGYTLPFHLTEIGWLPMDYNSLEKTPTSGIPPAKKPQKVVKKSNASSK